MTRLRFLDHSEANLRPERNGGNGFIPSGTEYVHKRTKSAGVPRGSADERRRRFPRAAGTQEKPGRRNEFTKLTVPL